MIFNRSDLPRAGRQRASGDIEHQQRRGAGGFIAAGTALVGAGLSYMGAKSNAAAQRDANLANIEAQKEANKQAYAQWLMTRGVGQNGQAVNTKLPLWAMANSNLGLPQTARRFRRVGSAPQTYDAAAAWGVPNGGALYPTTPAPAALPPAAAPGTSTELPQ